MKSFLRSFFISYLCVYLVQHLIHGFYYDSRSKILLILALTIMGMFIRPLLKALSLPEKGLGFLFLHFLLTLVIMFVLTLFIPNYGFVATETPNLNFLGFVITSKHLNATVATAVSAGLYTLFAGFFGWLYWTKK